MSQVTFLVERIVGDLARLASLVKNAPLDKVEIRILFKMLHDLLRYKTKMEIFASKQKGGKAVTEYLGISKDHISEIVTGLESSQLTACKDNQYADYNIVHDRLYGVADICEALDIAPESLAKWRRNWPHKNEIDLHKTKFFPPPIIYVYGAPLWSFRQINWWKNTMNNAGFFKVDDNDSNSNNG